MHYPAFMTETCFSILGDSISTFKGFIPEENECFYPREGCDVTKVEHTWWHILMQRTGWKLIANEAYSGSRISITGPKPPHSSFLSETRQRRLKGDIIIVFGGTNDWGQLEGPTTKEIFSASYEKLVSLMEHRYTTSTLYFCTPLQRTDRNLTAMNAQNWNQQELSAIIKETVARHEHAHLIDLFSYPIEAGDGMLCDGLHPSKKGMEMIATLMQKSMKL